MAYNLQEQDQIDALRAFLGRWGQTLWLSLLIVLIAIAGWRTWGWWQAKQSEKALAVFEQLEQAVQEAKLDRVDAASQVLFKDYPRTVYASMAALFAARAHIDAGDLKAAKAALEWALKSSKDAEFRYLARLRLAGILLDEKAYDEGLKLLDGDVPDSFSASFADRRGDLLIGQGKREDARAAYREALEKLEKSASLRPLVELKLDALGGR